MATRRCVLGEKHFPYISYWGQAIYRCGGTARQKTCTQTLKKGNLHWHSKSIIFASNIAIRCASHNSAILLSILQIFAYFYLFFSASNEQDEYYSLALPPVYNVTWWKTPRNRNGMLSNDLENYTATALLPFPGVPMIVPGTDLPYSIKVSFPSIQVLLSI